VQVLVERAEAGRWAVWAMTRNGKQVEVIPGYAAALRRLDTKPYQCFA
jgi:hypothetical protein